MSEEQKILLSQENKLDVQFTRNLFVWLFLAAQCAIGFGTTIYWVLWLLRDLQILD